MEIQTWNLADVSRCFSSKYQTFLWSACPSPVPACASQRRTANRDPRLLAAHSLGGPKGAKTMFGYPQIARNHHGSSRIFSGYYGFWWIITDHYALSWIIMHLSLSKWLQMRGFHQLIWRLVQWLVLWKAFALRMEWEAWKGWTLVQLFFFSLPQVVTNVDCVGEMRNIHISLCGCFVAFNILFNDRGNLCSILHLNFHSRLFPRRDKRQRLREHGGSRKLWTGCWLMCLGLLQSIALWPYHPTSKCKKENRTHILTGHDLMLITIPWFFASQTSLFRASTAASATPPRCGEWLDQTSSLECVASSYPPLDWQKTHHL